MDLDSMARRNEISEAHKHKQTSPDKNEERIGEQQYTKTFQFDQKVFMCG